MRMLHSGNTGFGRCHGNIADLYVFQQTEQEGLLS